MNHGGMARRTGLDVDELAGRIVEAELLERRSCAARMKHAINILV